MKKIICTIICLNFLFSFGVETKSNCYGRKSPRMELGIGMGYYHKSFSDKLSSQSTSYLLAMDYRLSNRWSIGITQQLGIFKEREFWAGREHQMKDIDAGLLIGRGFFKGNRLKLQMGISYSVREYLYYELKNDEEYYFMRCVVEADDFNVVKKSVSSLTIPVRIDLKVLRFHSMSLNLSAGAFTDIYSGGYSILDRPYIMPVLKFRI